MIDFKIKNLPTVNLNWWEPTQKQWAPILLKDQKPSWQQDSDPTTGRPWKSLTLKYRSWKDKRYPGQPVLRLTGAMQDRAEIQPNKDGFEVKTTAYGVYQQFGTRKMVARPWVGIPKTSLQHLAPIAWRNILS
jgi:hypothetical protein